MDVQIRQPRLICGLCVSQVPSYSSFCSNIAQNKKREGGGGTERAVRVYKFRLEFLFLSCIHIIFSTGSLEIRWSFRGLFKDIISKVHVRWVPCHHGVARPQVANGGDALQVWRLAANILNKQSRTVDKGWSPSLVVGRGANNSSP
jgi:hypothetical protein